LNNREATWKITKWPIELSVYDIIFNAGERRGEVAGAVNAGVNVFNDIEDGRLDERLRRGIMGGEMKARW
jgi:hypothetical protein